MSADFINTRYYFNKFIKEGRIYHDNHEVNTQLINDDPFAQWDCF